MRRSGHLLLRAPPEVSLLQSSFIATLETTNTQFPSINTNLKEDMIGLKFQIHLPLNHRDNTNPFLYFVKYMCLPKIIKQVVDFVFLF